MDYEALDISCRHITDDSDLFLSVINQGIDARLEAFVKSKFRSESGRLALSFHPDEVQILLRRLCEIYEAKATDDPYENEHVGLWIEDSMAASPWRRSKRMAEECAGYRPIDTARNDSCMPGALLSLLALSLARKKGNN
jgi:hypothetical protein